MATIKAFRPIRPNPLFADQLVFTKPQAESVAGDHTKEGGLKPLKTLLETGARFRPETPEGQELAFRDIRETLQSLLEKQQLWKEEKKGIYIYEVVHQNYRQTGIWALTNLRDYTGGDIHIHELTFDDSVRRLKNYREETGLEGNPVLLTYPPDTTIDAVIEATKRKGPLATLGNPQGLHQLWQIEDEEVQQTLINAFENVKQVYLADGHHRLGSAALLAAQLSEKGMVGTFDHISSLYMSTDQLRIEAYHRVVVPDWRLYAPALLTLLEKNFHIRESKGNAPVLPQELHQLGMCLDDKWYHLMAKGHFFENKDKAADFDAAILQEYILAPLFGITDPRTDGRLRCAGGDKAPEEVRGLLQAHPGAICFTLCPVSVSELTAAADAGVILPPKSTWIVPKVPYGLLIYNHEN